jgi:hypothetical protein
MRDAEIVASVARGRTQTSVALDFGLTRQQIGRIVADHRASTGGDVIDPVAEVRAILDLLNQTVDDMAVVQERADNSAAAIGAARLKLEAKLRRHDVLATLGLMPRDLRALPLGAELQAWAREVREILLRDDTPAATIDDIAAVSDRFATRHRTIGELGQAA